MNKKTADLKRRMLGLGIEDRLRILKNSYRGEECYIIACGPSLASIQKDKLREVLQDKLVVSVKQAYNILPDQTDFHVFNYIHLDSYKYSTKPITLELTRFGKVLSGSPDLPVPINVNTAGRYEYSVVATKKFDEAMFERRIMRPFGPGIVYEVCFFLAVHLGCSGVTTIGFDCAKLKSHFYGPDEVVDEKKQKILDKEMSDVVGGMIHFSEWLDSKSCPLKIISDINPAPNSIKRMRFEEIL